MTSAMTTVAAAVARRPGLLGSCDRMPFFSDFSFVYEREIDFVGFFFEAFDHVGADVFGSARSFLLDDRAPPAGLRRRLPADVVFGGVDRPLDLQRVRQRRDREFGWGLATFDEREAVLLAGRDGGYRRDPGDRGGHVGVGERADAQLAPRFVVPERVDRAAFENQAERASA